jgi:lysozyme family protein
MTTSRRGFITSSLSLSVFLSSTSQVRAQQPQSLSNTTLSSDPEFRGVLKQAADLQLVGSQAAAAGSKNPLDLAELIYQALAKGPENNDAANFALRAGRLLSEITRSQHDGFDLIPGGPVPTSARYTYVNTKQQYTNLFRSAKISPSANRELTRAARLITASSAKSLYQAVQDATGVPWYVIGALHYREANLNFLGHLHNGDLLFVQTVHVPAQRPPKPWSPPAVTDPRQLWQLSAVDALRNFPINDITSDVSIEQLCYACEAYNGFGCRAHGINSPYLWNLPIQVRQGNDGNPRLTDL